MIGAVRLIQEEFEAPFEGDDLSLMRKRIDEVYRMFIGKRNRSGEFFFISHVEQIVKEYIVCCRAGYFLEKYHLPCKYSKRKRKKLRLGEHRSYQRYYIRVEGREDYIVDAYRLYDVALKSRKNGE